MPAPKEMAPEPSRHEAALRFEELLLGISLAIFNGYAVL